MTELKSLEKQLQELHRLRSINSTPVLNQLDYQIDQIEDQISMIHFRQKERLLETNRKFIGKVCIIHVRIYGCSGEYHMGMIHEIDAGVDPDTNRVCMRVLTDPIYYVKEHEDDDWKAKPFWDGPRGDGWHLDVDRIEEAYEW